MFEMKKELLLQSECNLTVTVLFHSQIFTTWSSIPITYCFSFLFSNSLAAYGLLMIFFFFVAMLTQTVVILVDADAADIIHYIFLIFPTYGYVSCIVTVLNVNV